MSKERKAEWVDTVGDCGRYLFARHKLTGHRISARRFYREHEGDYLERDGYVLMTTGAARRENSTPKGQQP